MTSVWIVSGERKCGRGNGYESGYLEEFILGVFSTEELARAACETAEATAATEERYISLDIEPAILDEVIGDDPEDNL